MRTLTLQNAMDCFKDEAGSENRQSRYPHSALSRSDRRRRSLPARQRTRIEQHWIREEGAVVDAGVELAALVTRIGRGWQFVQ